MKIELFQRDLLQQAGNFSRKFTRHCDNRFPVPKKVEEKGVICLYYDRS
jgi:coproporphyrinogen III oxidase